MCSNLLLRDVALTIISLLEARDVCSLGCCSCFWRDLCFSNCVWAHLFRRRWPHADVAQLNRSTCAASGETPLIPPEGWKALYIESHKKIAQETSFAIHEIDQGAPLNSLEVTRYLSAIKQLSTLSLGFEDVCLFLFRPKLSVVVNLIGLHYSILYLHIPPKEVFEALTRCQVARRQVCLSWLKVGRWLHGFRLRDENYTRRISLEELTMSEEEPILAMLNRGAVHEVIRIQICSADSRMS
ncbi:F-box-like protein [Rhynchospora pubera]|uniref:F-box-like protein n=1 Tax=Rhynchospora pubera TaxID=906938 RepID=A0AAV8GFJ4_9POAL|nr:F-box-like protein [Rhynchospora pubera]